MKTFKTLFTFVLLLTLVVSCKQETQEPEVKIITTSAPVKKKELNPNATFAKAEFNIEGMSCAVGCAAKIEKSIAQMDGVKSAKVDFENKTAMVEYDVDEVNPEKLTNRVAKSGDYKVENMQTVDAFSGLE